jgi:hypothetical protein
MLNINHEMQKRLFDKVEGAAAQVVTYATIYEIPGIDKFGRNLSLVVRLPPEMEYLLTPRIRKAICDGYRKLLIEDETA